jgi:hypothetical protein
MMFAQRPTATTQQTITSPRTKYVFHVKHAGQMHARPLDHLDKPLTCGYGGHWGGRSTVEALLRAPGQGTDLMGTQCGDQNPRRPGVPSK